MRSILPLRRAAVHPVLRGCAREAGSLGLRLAAYAGLLLLSMVMATALWTELPAAVSAAQLLPPSGSSGAPPRLRGSL